jgi:flagellar hook protein FlgE
MSSFSIALSALDADTTALNVIGNNLANLNTTGYKTNDVSFQDLMSSLEGNAQIGGGVAPPTTERQFLQGTVNNTSGLLDAAINGNGFFIVTGQDGSTMYTRDGSFQTSPDGTLVTANGDAVQGWTATNGVISTSGAIGDITIPSAMAQPASATQNLSTNINLDASTATNGEWSTQVSVIDSLGVSHTVTMNFTKTDANTWSYDVEIPQADLSSSGGSGSGSGSGSSSTTLGSGTLTFDSSGNLTGVTPDSGSGGGSGSGSGSGTTPVALSATGLADGAADLNINWNLFDASGNGDITQYAQASSLSGSTQDGTPSAQVTQVDIEDGGMLMAHFSNGQSQVVGQLAVASIQNPETLIDLGNNNYSIGADTATPVAGAAQTGGRGQIIGGGLEASNVDIATQLTNLIVFQRSYQANSRAITTQDEVTQEVLNLIK